MIVYLVEGEHPTIPGIRRSLHTLPESAKEAADALLDLIAGDLGLKCDTVLSGPDFVAGEIARACREEGYSAHVNITEIELDETPTTDILRRIVFHFGATSPTHSLIKVGREHLARLTA